jgi:hypothetical protein
MTHPAYIVSRTNAQSGHFLDLRRPSPVARRPTLPYFISGFGTINGLHYVGRSSCVACPSVNRFPPIEEDMIMNNENSRGPLGLCRGARNRNVGTSQM